MGRWQQIAPPKDRSFLDASAVYGFDEERARALRTLDGTGKLKTSDGDLLPFNSTEFFPDGPLDGDNNGASDPSSLFVAGDERASENPGLISLHTLLVREHNRLTEEIGLATPALSGDEIYQQARRLVRAQLQHITYSEYVPLVVGELAPYPGYNPEVDPSISAFFATAANRIGHSQSSPQIWRLDAAGEEIASGHLGLMEAFFNTVPVVEDGIEPVLRGLAAQNAQAVDTQVIDELRNMLFGPPGAGGLDLAAIGLQRGRDLGLPSYTQARRDFGLEPVTSFAQLTSDPELQAALAAVYNGDGISTPAGEGRPSARAVSNAAFDQQETTPPDPLVTAMSVFWSQLVAHDLSQTPTGVSETLKIFGTQFEDGSGVEYPFVAEPLPLLLGHGVYEGYNNVIERPIYLPKLDTANAVTIDPQVDTTVTTTAIPGMELHVAAGSLQDSDGNDFSGQLSITEVPADLTPASLPATLHPDLVVTIQPAEMGFSEPAPLDFPNTAGYLPGTEMELWSIDPVSGEFEVVGEMVVSADGESIETVSGGVRTSSWHFPAPSPPAPVLPGDDPRNPDDGFDPLPGL